MNTKSNPVPEHYVALCSSENTDRLVRLNLYLRSQGLDARYTSVSAVGSVIKVPPEQHAKAGELRDVWLNMGSDFRKDYRAVRDRVAQQG